MSPRPPKWALRFLRWYCCEDYVEEIEGDLTELFEVRMETSPKNARVRFLWDVIRSFRISNFKNISPNNLIMHDLANYIKVYFRRFRNEKSHYLVNIAGLALGLTAFFFTLIYVYDEQHIDQFHSKKDRIYRVLETSTTEEGTRTFTTASNPLGKALRDDFPEIEAYTNMFYVGSNDIKRGDVHFSERNYAITSPALFDIFDFEILAGDHRSTFEREIAVVLSETTATRLFGDENPVGQTIENPNIEQPVEVLAVIADMPASSTYQFSVIYFANFDIFGKAWHRDWTKRNMATFVLFAEGSNPETVLSQKTEFLSKYVDQSQLKEHDFSFQPISDMHLHSSDMEAISTEPLMAIPYSKSKFVSIILLIGSFVLLLASLNYINLSSVQALKRTKEAGVRKVNGASNRQLRIQLFVETLITLLFAFTTSILLLYSFHGSVMDITHKSIPFSRFFELDLLQIQAGVLILLWVLSALIPAIYYSRLNRISAITKNVFSGKGDTLRKAFITIQYAISLTLIVGSLVVYSQMHYIQSKDLGFDKEQMIILDINSGAARRNFKNMVSALRENPNIIHASSSSRVPGEWKAINMAALSTIRGENEVEMYHYAADEFWFETYSMTLLQGRNFNGAAGDTLKVILNETAVNRLGLQDPVGSLIWVNEDTLAKMEVIGVVKDFHFESLHKQMEPVFITSWNNFVSPVDYFSVKYKGNVTEVLSHMEQVQARFDPLTPPEINFLDQKWNRYYEGDQSRGMLILIATIVSIIISSIGLFGLVNFTAERKAKEIGIRKVMGASLGHILRLILHDYALLLLIALVIAAPISWWALQSWLDGYAYRISLSPLQYGIAFGVIGTVSLLTVIFKVRKLALANPVNSLRYE